MPEVLAALQAWRDAERDLRNATDAEDIEQLAERVRMLHAEYERLVAERAAKHDIPGHAEDVS